MHYGQQAWHGPISLILIIQMSNIESVPPIYLPVLLT